jgi:iduronate 2-sulfatase
MMKFPIAIVSLLLLLPPAGARPNILFIAVDDLRPQLGCYGYEQMITPNIDTLAKRGMLFERAYCQAATCRASRLSLLTGLRPDTTRIRTNGGAHFRTRTPNLVTLPQQFKINGYHAESHGKIFHGAFTVRGKWNDPKSWSVPAWWPGPRYYYTPPGIAAAKNVFSRSGQGKGKPAADWVNHFVLGPSWEAPDVADNVLYDGQVAEKGIETLRKIHRKPFFLALGFLKPHLPFIAPKKYWDLYPPDEVVEADNQHAPKDAPKLALTNWGHPRSYTDVPGKGPMPKQLVPRLTRGYAACVTYVDAQVGRVLNELDRLGLRDNTIVVFWGDHGFHLGENAIWGKATNFELSTHVPLIISAPKMGAKGGRTRALVELVDLYPTLAELAGLPTPKNLQGKSMVPLLGDPDQKWKPAAFSQFPRNRAMGRSMRTDRWRFTLWQEGQKTVVRELYDHQNDPAENTNVANLPEHADIVARLTRQLETSWNRQP